MSYSLSSGHSVRLGGLSPLRMYFSLRTEMSKHRPRTEARRWQGPLYNTVRTPTVKTVWGTKDHIHIYIYICVCVVWVVFLFEACIWIWCAHFWNVTISCCSAYYVQECVVYYTSVFEQKTLTQPCAPMRLFSNRSRPWHILETFEWYVTGHTESKNLFWHTNWHPNKYVIESTELFEIGGWGEWVRLQAAPPRNREIVSFVCSCVRAVEC